MACKWRNSMRQMEKRSFHWIIGFAFPAFSYRGNPRDGLTRSVFHHHCTTIHSFSFGACPSFFLSLRGNPYSFPFFWGSTFLFSVIARRAQPDVAIHNFPNQYIPLKPKTSPAHTCTTLKYSRISLQWFDSGSFPFPLLSLLRIPPQI